MAQSLAGNSNYTVIPNANNDLSQLKPGDIIISPLVGADGGHHLITSDEHVGVYVGDGQVVSNNSGRAQIGNPMMRLDGPITMAILMFIVRNK